jgi:RNA polymerase sigma-B factor
MRDAIALHTPERHRSAAHTKRADDERALFLRYHDDGDVAARDELIARFLPLARQIARRYRRGRDSFDDLLQVASIGLIKAVDRYEPDYGTSFTTFAVPSISGEVKRYFRDSGWAVRVPRPVQERVLKVNEAVDRLQRQTGRSPTPRAIAAALGEDVEAVLEAMEAATAYDSVSLDAPMKTEDGDAADYASTVGEPDNGYALVEERTAIEPAMRELPDREQLILKLRFEEDKTQSEIADTIGISQMHVSRLLRRALMRLRAAAEADPE